MEKHITMHECFCDTREDNPDILHLVWSFGRAYFLLPEHVVRVFFMGHRIGIHT